MHDTDLLTHLEGLHGRAFGWAMVCCGRDRERAADVLQSSYARVLSRLRPSKDAQEAVADVRAFLFGVIKNVAHEELARSRRQEDGTKDFALLHSPMDARPASVLDAVADGETQQAMRSSLRDAIDALPRRQQEVLHLVFYQEMTLAEAAEVLGIQVGSARTHYARAKDALRTQCAPMLRESI